MGCRDTLRSLEYGRGDFPPDRYGLDLKTRRLYGVYCSFGWWRFSLLKPPASCRYLDVPEKSLPTFFFGNTCSWSCHYNTWVFHALNTLHFTIFREREKNKRREKAGKTTPHRGEPLGFAQVFDTWQTMRTSVICNPWPCHQRLGFIILESTWSSGF